MTTDKDEWKKIRIIFEDALRRPLEERAAFVKGACGDDSELRSEVETLLDSLESAEQFLETPAVIQVTENTVELENRFSTGDRLLHYEIRELLGLGGMGEVYLARDTKLNRNVAIKVLRPTLLPDSDVKRRLLREARAAALLEHPNICQIYEISEAGDNNFIVMQYIVGTTIAEMLSENRPDILHSLDLGIQIVDGLAEAHAHGIVHRDIKPANIIVNKKGQAKILDFGLAKFIEAETNGASAQHLMSSGAVMGTVPFMSPEQLRGKAVDARTDIFSVGVLLFELLTGTPAFDQDSNAETIAAILNDEPDYSLVPNGIRPIIRRCLAKSVDERYESAAVLLKDLRHARDHVTSDPIPVSTGAVPNPVASTDGSVRAKKREFHLWQITGDADAPPVNVPTAGKTKLTIGAGRLLSSVAAILIIIGVAAGLWNWEQRGSVGGHFDALRPVRLVSWKSGAVTNATDFRISSDGRMVAYSSSEHGTNEAIYIKQTSDGEDLQITKDAWTNVSPLWSPDNQRIAFVSMRGDQTGIYECPTLGGTVTLLKLTEKANVSLRHWSRDGSAIFYDQAGNLYRLDLTSGDTVKITDLPELSGVSTRFFAVSPDETGIAFVDSREGQKDIWIVRATGGARTRITNDKEPERRLVWHPDGDRLLYNVYRNDFTQINMVWTDGGGQPVAVTRGEGRYSLMNVSPEGDRIFYSTTEPRSDISSIDLETGRETEIAATAESEFWTDVSPDGRSIVYHSNGSPNPTGKIGSSTLAVKTSDGETKRLANEGFDVRWLPDNRHLSLFRKSEGTVSDFNVWILDTATGSERRMTSESVMPAAFSVLPITRVDVGVLDFSSDGQRAVYVDGNQPQNVKLTELESGALTDLTKNQISNFQYFSPTFSRDGKFIAVVALEESPDPNAKSRARVQIIDGGTVRDIYTTTDSVRLIGWTVEDDLVVATTAGGLHAPIDVQLIALSTSGSVRNISTLPMAYPRTITIASDGRLIAFTGNQDERDDIWTVAPIPGATPRRITRNSTTRQFLTNLAFSPDGKTIYFDKQEEINTISILENFN